MEPSSLCGDWQPGKIQKEGSVPERAGEDVLSGLWVVITGLRLTLLREYVGRGQCQTTGTPKSVMLESGPIPAAP